MASWSSQTFHHGRTKTATQYSFLYREEKNVLSKKSGIRLNSIMPGRNGFSEWLDTSTTAAQLEESSTSMRSLYKWGDRIHDEHPTGKTS